MSATTLASTLLDLGECSLVALAQASGVHYSTTARWALKMAREGQIGYGRRGRSAWLTAPSAQENLLARCKAWDRVADRPKRRTPRSCGPTPTGAQATRATLLALLREEACSLTQIEIHLKTARWATHWRPAFDALLAEGFVQADTINGETLWYAP